MRFFFKDKDWYDNFYILNKLSESIRTDYYPRCITLHNIVCYDLNYFNNLPPHKFNVGVFEDDDIYLINASENQKKDYIRFCLKNNIEFNE